MYFTAKELADYANRDSYNRQYLRERFGERGQGGTMEVKEARAILKKVHGALVARDSRYIFSTGLAKWLRPWHVVPALANFTAPEGDFSVGVEVEQGFVSRQAMSTIAEKIIRWKYVTLDWEGGTYPIEATFPPTLYSKFSSKSQVVRYTKILQENEALIARGGNNVGTHVNVGCRDFWQLSRNGDRIATINSYLRHTLTEDEKFHYFGRRQPYGYGYGNRNFVEWKLFRSTSDPQKLKSYVHIGVALTKLAVSGEGITEASVRAALESGYSLAYPN